MAQETINSNVTKLLEKAIFIILLSNDTDDQMIFKQLAKSYFASHAYSTEALWLSQKHVDSLITKKFIEDFITRKNIVSVNISQSSISLLHPNINIKEIKSLINKQISTAFRRTINHQICKEEKQTSRLLNSFFNQNRPIQKHKNCTFNIDAISIKT